MKQPLNKQSTQVPQERKPRKATRNNRTAGHNYERECAVELREIGFKHVVCSREESVARDGQKIDLMNQNELENGRLPYNIQCKNSCQPVKYLELLKGGKVKFITDRKTGKKLLAEVKPLPKVKGVINVIFHKYTVESAGGKFIAKGQFAILEKSDFLEMVEKLERWGNFLDGK